MKRPVAVTVFGILHIVFAAFGVFGVVATAALLFVKPAAVGNNPVLKDNPALKAIDNNPGYATWIKVSIPLSLAQCLILLLAGIGLLLLKEWGRKLSLVYGVFAICITIANMIVSYVFLIGPLLEEAARQKGPANAEAMGGAFGGMIGGCFGLVYPILVLIFMTRPRIKAAFVGPPISEQSDNPPEW